MAKKSANKKEVRPVVQTPVKVCLRRVSRALGRYSRKVLPSATVNETDIERMAGCDEGTVEKILDAVKKCVGEGKDVDLCESLRFYGVVDKNAELILCSQTMNPYRRSISNVKYVTVIRDSGKHETAIDNDEGQRAVARGLEQRRNLVCVPPDSVVACPKCGYEFRVGRSLTNVK